MLGKKEEAKRAETEGKKLETLCSSDSLDFILQNSVLKHFKSSIVRRNDHALPFESPGRIE